MNNKMERIIIYTLKDGTEEIFAIGNGSEDEQHERATAEREIHDPKSHVVDYRFEWRSDNTRG